MKPEVPDEAFALFPHRLDPGDLRRRRLRPGQPGWSAAAGLVGDAERLGAHAAQLHLRHVGWVLCWPGRELRRRIPDGGAIRADLQPHRRTAQSVIGYPALTEYPPARVRIARQADEP